MRLPHEALLEEEQLDSWPFGVVEHFDEEVPQVHLDARSQFGQRPAVKIVVVLERDLAGMLVDFDHVGL